MFRTAGSVDWVVFVSTVLLAMLVDRAICIRDPARVGFRTALYRSLLWIAAGLGFALWVQHAEGFDGAVTYLTAYLVEKSLSLDNLFVFLVIFRYFRVTDKQQERVLFWGVFGAVVLRAVFILAGAALLQRFNWASYVFGAILVISGIRLARSNKETIDPSRSAALRLAVRFLRTTPKLDGARFFTKKDQLWYATPLFLVLVVIEMTDLLFAVDSVPAVLAISNDLFVVYTSNVMAILGLRALFFLLAGMMDKFHRLDIALACILVFVGLKMAGHDLFHVGNGTSLIVIVTLIVLGIAASWLWPPKSEPRPAPSPAPPHQGVGESPHS